MNFSQHHDITRNEPPKPDRSDAIPLIDEILPQLCNSGGHSAIEALKTLLANAPDPFLLFDQQANLVARNRYAEEFWEGHKMFIPTMLLSQVVRTAKSGKTFQADRDTEIVEMESREGKRYFVPRVVPLFPMVGEDSDQSPETPWIACILKDETEWVRAERVRNNLFSSISHELNTPLTSARLALYLLAEKKIGDLNPAQTDMVERAKEDLDREIATIRNVLDLIRSRPTAQNLSMPESLNVHVSSVAVIDIFQKQTGTFGKLITREYANRSPWVRIEKDFARMAIHLLFSSVLKYCKDPTKITIKTEVFEREGYCRISVSTRLDPESDFIPSDLFKIPMESPEARMLNCADLGLRVAQEIMSPNGGGFETLRNENQASVSFHYPTLAPSG